MKRASLGVSSPVCVEISASFSPHFASDNGSRDRSAGYQAANAAASQPEIGRKLASYPC